MPEAARQRVLAAALEVVETQLRDDDPPETRETFDRLVGEGHTEAEAKRLIAAVVLAEIGRSSGPTPHSTILALSSPSTACLLCWMAKTELYLW